MATTQEITATKVFTGEAYQELSDAFAENKRQFSQLDDIRARIDGLPSSQQAAAMQAYNKANAAATAQYGRLVQARSAYNDIVNAARTVSFGQYQPSYLSGLGALGIEPVTLALIAALVAAAGYALSQLASVFGAYKGQENATRGYIDQAASLARAPGDVAMGVGAGFESFSKGVLNIAQSTDKFAWFAIAGLGVFLGYKLITDPSLRSSVSGALKRKAA